MHHVLLFFFTPHLNLWAIRHCTAGAESNSNWTELFCDTQMLLYVSVAEELKPKINIVIGE